jgi:thiol:disulfide interchange protein DsbC
MTEQRRSLVKTYGGMSLLAVAAASALAVGLTGSIAVAEEGGAGSSGVEKALAKTLAKSFPNTAVSAVDCGREAAPKGFCEVVAGRNVFYATPDGRYVLIGQVVDLEKKVDLTDRRLREIASVVNVEDRIAGRLAEAPPAPSGAQGLPPVAPAKGAPPPPAAVLKVSLPIENAIVHNRGGKLKMSVFTDFNCHFCQQLFRDLMNNKDIEVTEYPIAVLGPDSEAKARMVLCSKDREAASSALYKGGTLQSVPDCPDGAKRLQENLAFAQSHGINGTPMLVRPDGATNPGWMPADQLTSWLAQSRG